MRALTLLRSGFGRAVHHRRLVVVAWLASLLPALVLAGMVAGNLAPALDRSLFSDEILDGEWFPVWIEFRDSPADSLDPILGAGVLVFLGLSVVVQILLSAGIVEVLVERETVNPFVLGVRRNAWRFARSAGVMLVGLLVVAGLVWLVTEGFFELAAARSDGRLDLVGVGLAAVLALVIFAALDLAYDLSRIAAVRHGDRSMVLGFFRALGAVLRRPGLFVPLALLFGLLPVALHLGYFAIRAPMTPSTAAAIVGLLIAQQLVMMIRAVLKISFWGAEAAAYGVVGEPRFCSPWGRSRWRPWRRGGGGEPAPAVARETGRPPVAGRPSEPISGAGWE